MRRALWQVLEKLCADALPCYKEFANAHAIFRLPPPTPSHMGVGSASLRVDVPPDGGEGVCAAPLLLTSDLSLLFSERAQTATVEDGRNERSRKTHAGFFCFFH